MGNALEGTTGQADVMIIGGGPTGIGAAYRLNQYGHNNWFLLDAEKQPGGLAGSIKTHEGFRFDHGYKTFFSRYKFLDCLMDDCHSKASPRKLMEKSRDNYVFVKGRLVRYPLQNNLSGLPEKDQESCAVDLLCSRIRNKETKKAKDEDKKNEEQIDQTEEKEDITEEKEDIEQTQEGKDEAAVEIQDGDSHVSDDNTAPSEEGNDCEEIETLDHYLLRNWGESLCNILFRPYIFKSFAYPSSKLTSSWAESKIPPSILGDDIEKIIRGEQSDPGHGADAITIYPSKGGLVSFWRTIVRKLPKENVRFKSEIVDLDIEQKLIRTKDGLEIKYNTLISTMPITSLLELAGREDLGESLAHSSLHIVCLGIRGVSTMKDIKGCIYYPESDCIFHRACVFSSFDPDSIPDKDQKIPTLRFAKPSEDGNEIRGSSSHTGPYWSLLLEISGGPLKTIHDATIMDEVIRDACAVGLLRPDDEIVSIHMTEMTHGYPLPTLESEIEIDKALNWLQSKGIYSRGRFGSFKYHVGDLDQCLIQGVEAVDNIIKGEPEKCIWSKGNEISSEGKIPYPVYNLEPITEEESQLINAGAIRSAITREPLTSVGSSTTSVTTSSATSDAGQLSDSETGSSVSGNTS